MKSYLLLALLLSACSGGFGGGGHAPAQPTVASAPAPAPQCTGNPYYPLCDGSSITYSAYKITAAHYDAPTHQLLLDNVGGSPAIGSTLNESVTLGSCSTFPGLTFFNIHYAFSRSATSTDPYLADAVFSTPDNRQYLGEDHGAPPSPVSNHGEPLLTMNPVIGEEIDSSYETAPACGGVMAPVAFTSQYFTAAHFESWTAPNGQVFSDVWEDTLIERPNTPDAKVYNYYFQRNLGIVAFTCYATLNPALNTYTDCGNLYVALPK